MNDPLPRPVESAPRRLDQSSETAQNLIEATGNPPAAASAARPTVASDRPTAPPSATVAPQRLGDYAVVRKIGEGGMGTVYLAEDTKLHRKAAVKTLKAAAATNPTDRDRFEREARAAAAVEHDNIVPIWQVGEAADGTPFIAMPFLQGEMLDARLKRDPVANLGLILKVAREVADGLTAAHAKGLIHRDIKPGNIWLEGDLSSKQLAEQVRRCKILDFGLARSVDVDDTQITASGAILGTPAYMSPEQARAEKADHRTDLFSLGVTLYRMATGQLPFRGATAMSTLIALATETPRSVRTLAPRLPAAVADLIERLMAKDPAARPQSAAAVSAAVRDIVKNLQAKQAGKAESGSRPVPVLVLPEAAPNPWEDVTEPETDEPLAKAPKPAKRSRAPWYLAAGVLGLFALVAALGVIIVRVETAEGTLVVEVSDPDVEARVKNGKLVLVGPDGKEKYTISPADRDKKIDAGAYKIRVEGADGLALDTSEFTLKKNGLVTVRVTLDPKLAKKTDPPKKDAAKVGADRKAATYVLSAGGKVGVNDGDCDITAVKDLPREPIRLTAVELRGNGQVAERDMAQFAGCRHLKHLNMENTSVDDAGLAYLADCKDLWRLNVPGTRVTNTSMAHFRHCVKLAHLNLWATGVGDDGLTNFKECKELIGLCLGRTTVTDTGLENFKHCTQLLQLYLQHTTITDAGLAHFKECSLTHLCLDSTQVSDSGLTQFKSCGSLRELTLNQTPVGDVGLSHFVKCKRLAYLDVRRTKVTAEKVAELKKALPQCRIDWDGGTIEPSVPYPDSDRKAAEYVLSVGGSVELNGTGIHIRKSDQLPGDLFRLTSINLANVKRVTDEGLAACEGCVHLVTLGLSETPVGDAGVAHFRDSKKLVHLDLKLTKVTDAGLAHFKNCIDLERLFLWGMGHITDAGLAHFKGCKKLTDLVLNSVQTSDQGLAVFKDCKNIREMDLSGTRVTDKGLLNFENCAELNGIALGGTRITSSGLRALKGCTKLTALELPGTQVTDEALESIKQFKGLRRLWVFATQISAKGVADLALALPECQIAWKGGVIEPATAADRAAAEWVLAAKGSVQVNGDATDIKAKADLPKGLFRLTGVLLTTPVQDADLAVLKDCKNLAMAYLGGTKITNAGLEHLKGCASLTDLNLSGTGVDDGAVAVIKGFARLKDLSVGLTKISGNGVKEIAAALPGCRIQYDGGTIEPTKK